MKTAGLIFWICLLGLVVIILSFTSYHATDSTEVGVRTIKWLGKRGVENQVYQPGAAYFFLPVINDWSTFDTKLQVLEMHGPQQMTIKTRDGNDLYVDVTFSFRIDPKMAPYVRQFVARNDEELREKVFLSVARSRTRDFLGALSTDEFTHTEQRNQAVEKAREGLQEILKDYGLIVERVAVMDYRFDPDYLKVITDKKIAEAKSLEVRAQIEAQREANTRMLNEAEGQVKALMATTLGRYSNAVSSADTEFEQKRILADAILTEGTNTSLAIIKQREAMASAGGETQIQMAFATNLVGKRILMIPSGNAVNLQTLDLNKALESLLKK
ncbi:MAG TPA: SPFH domain-containing protein [Candidatus Paceibacterota bacterium]|nr:SPFH domain-containing protein [Candidatus Paceibacterota bacterium]HSA01644.1 SPFH domain-containing protein [Candidatus Paceibacterota bacterium]